jgi:anti-anti-sigma factor
MEFGFAITMGFREGYRVLVLEGDLDLLSSETLEKALEACADGYPVIVDLDALTFIESTGLHVLLKERPTGRPAAIVCASASNIGRVLDIIEAGETIPVYEDMTVALDALDFDSTR